MLNITKPKYGKKIISGSIATLFIALQLPLALFASPLAAAQNNTNNVQSNKTDQGHSSSNNEGNGTATSQDESHNIMQNLGGDNDNNDDHDAKVTLCHATGSATNPYVKITVAAAGAFNGHYGSDGDRATGDIIPAFVYDGMPYGPQGNLALLAYPNCVAPVVAPTTVDEHVGLGGGGSETPANVLSLFTPARVAANNQVGRGGQLVNTGSTTLLNIFAGLFVIGAAAALTATSSKRRYS